MDRKTLELFGIEALNSVADTKQILKRSTSGVYADLAAGRLTGLKIGGSTRVTGESIVAYIESAPTAVLTTGLRGRADLTQEEKARLAAPSQLGAEMQVRRRGRPVGSKSKPRAEALKELENRPAA